MLAATLLIPLIAAALFTLKLKRPLVCGLNVAASLGTLIAVLFLLAAPPQAGTFLFVDGLNGFFLALGSFIGLTTSLFSARYIAHEHTTGRIGDSALRFYHALFQLMLFDMNLSLLANNIGLMWVALELATMTTVLMVGLYRTSAAIEAAWKYFILGSVGIALALFGTILIYMAARGVMGDDSDAMLWTSLITAAPKFDGAMLNLAFVFLLLGYGTKIGLVPLHAWLPDAHGEGPTPITAVLSGLLLNVALHALLRFKMILAANPAVIPPGVLMIALGLASVIFAAFMLYRRPDLKRLFGYSSVEHMGLIVFAFGIAGPAANFAALLQTAMHSLGKSAIFFAVGPICQAMGTQRIDRMGGLTASSPFLGWSLVAGVVAIVGMPPFGVFMSEFLIITATFARQPALAVLLGLGLLAAFAALLLRLNAVAFGAPQGEITPVPVARTPLVLHLLLVLAAGLYLPPALAAWLHEIAVRLG
ncbi:MAG: hydrogenase 4 subunit F [Alphaproteobacteria bacterium]|nr:hydrogenase 4 subunit F [Alphaproteobacteria bacterium]